MRRLEGEGQDMAFRNSFLSRLFGQQKGEGAEPEEEQEQAEEQQLPEKDEPKSKIIYELDLPKDHSLFKLRDIFSEQTGIHPQPSIALEDDTDTLFTAKEAQAELVRLRIAVNSSAKMRLEQIRSQQKTEDKGQQKEDGQEEKPALPDMDAEVRVFITKSGTSAWVFVYPPVGHGRELDKEMLRDALEQQEVLFGVDQEMLRKLPGATDRYFRLVLAAKGQLPMDGEDGYVEDHFPRTQEHKLKVDENNRVDFMNIDFIHNVEEGGVICRIIDPTDGTPGRTVQDKEIPARRGREAEIPKGRNTDISKDGGALVATITGHVEFSGREFNVKPVLDIPGNVDFSVGNIDFLGDVRIHGDVCSGFTVKATGTINVEGVVEACTIEAGKDLILVKGVQGNNQAVIRSMGNVFAKYLESSSIYAKVNLDTECLINCTVYCDGNVSVNSGHKSIIGGRVSAAREVSAGVVGSRTGSQTEILVGGSPCEAFDYDELDREIDELGQAIVRVNKQPDSPGKIDRLMRLQAQHLESRSRLEAIQKARQDMEREQAVQEQTAAVCHFRADTVYPGAVLTMGDRMQRFTEKVSPCHASLQDGEIHFT